ncbi:hypothetical protein [Hymenobacter lapidiphilus]|uniref:Uncharacterized protein n=1 Tax=Hymenobacter lapidiphilus TaxID=2608003 RepID=A0A7Y7PSG0_9BACT|nr:hypothetical protein [Hymenobacter lapidiphilus]NVO33205.1 hypothetical protein [Hymenobacter lapidiphilus]
MPYANQDPARLRFTLLINGQGFVVYPTVGGSLKITRQAADDAFYLRDILSGALLLGGADDPETWRILYGLDNSADRCTPLFLLLDTRAYPGAEWKQRWRGTFTLNECSFNRSLCQVEVTPVADDGYRDVLENQEKEFNILSYSTSANRRAVRAQLATLAADTIIEFRRIDSNELGDFAGVEGWTTFLTNTSWITGVGRSRDVLIFRYRLNDDLMVPVPDSGGEYVPVDRSAQGWEPLFETIDATVTPHTIDYVKAPEISGFPRAGYKIGTYQDWFGRIYGDQLLLLPCGQSPPGPGYVQVTSPGASNSDVCGGPCLNVRRSGNDVNCKSLFWRFGEFRFTRGFPLLDAVRGLLKATVAGTSAVAIVPPTAAQLSDFFTNPVNPATGATGAANEVPGLLLSAASDVKRYGASEPATKVLISLKSMLDDLAALYDVGWFIDPVTGWFRIEHRAWREAGAGATVLDLTTAPETILSEAYSYRTDKLPRTEELTIAAALTQDAAKGYFFDKASIEYTGQCVNTREGQNKQTRSASRLTGDVAGMVLSGERLPDSALVLLAAAPDGLLQDGNRKAAASELLKRYHRRGRVRPTGTVAGQLLDFQSVKPGRLQEGLSARLCSLDQLGPAASITTNLGPGGQLDKAEWDLLTGIVSLSIALPSPDSTEPGPVPPRRAFNESWNLSFG